MRAKAWHRAGYADALERHDIPLDPSLMKTCMPQWLDAMRATHELLGQPAPPSALVCFNDLLALGAMLALSESWVMPGRDFAVVGYDDIQLAGVWQPGLTTVAVPPRDIGREAGRLLLERVGGSAPRSAQRILLAPRLVTRESCGASHLNEVR